MAYALVALGFVLALNAAGAVNFAHGDLVVLGGATAMLMGVSVGLPGVLLLPVVALALGLAGILAARVALRHVGRRFGGVDALRDVSLTIECGEVVGLIGPNGSGKTSLINVVSGLVGVDSGSILLDDVHLERLPPHLVARAGVARTFQAVMLDGDSKAADLARALARRAPFLLLDEPAAGMGEGERPGLADLLRRLRGAGYGILIVDHDVELLSSVCDRLVCLGGGRVIAEGTPAEVRADRRVRASSLGLAEAA
jgi:branched-chain amino acid transport system permease protein